MFCSISTEEGCRRDPRSAIRKLNHAPQTPKTKIARLEREIAEIDDHLYYWSREDEPALYATMLDVKRDDMVRGTVLQIHTSIEDMLNVLIIRRVFRIKAKQHRAMMRSPRGRALRKMLYGAGSIGFEKKLDIAIDLKLFDKTTRTKLKQLNTLRNSCSHNWLLKGPVRRGRKPIEKKLPLLQYRGHNLHKVDVLKDFHNEFIDIYVRLYGKLA